MSEIFSDRLMGLRGKRKKSEFSRFLGVSAQVYQRYEDGRIPAAGILSDIAKRCGVSVEWLLTGEESVTTKLSYGIRERLFAAKGATGLSVPELARLMNVGAKEVERVMNEGGPVSSAFVDAFERELQPRIDAVKTHPNPSAPCTKCAKLESELTRANAIIDALTSQTKK